MKECNVEECKYIKQQRKTIEEVSKERNELQQRIDKAIEFICKKDMEANLTGEALFNSNELTEILKGE